MESEELYYTCISLAVLAVCNKGNCLALLDSTSLNSSDTDPSDVRVRVNVGNEELKGSFRIALRAGCVLDYSVKERCEVKLFALLILLKVKCCDTGLTG